MGTFARISLIPMYDSKNTVDSIHEWHSRARPTPDEKAFNVQLGCHFEEIAEQLESLSFKFQGWPEILGKNSNAFSSVKMLADGLKSGRVTASILNRKEFLDSVGDQVVTGIGAAYCANMDVVEAIRRIDDSNWSKFVNGQPVFNEQGKIAKPDTYKAPNLEGLY